MLVLYDIKVNCEGCWDVCISSSSPSSIQLSTCSSDWLMERGRYCVSGSYSSCLLTVPVVGGSIATNPWRRSQERRCSGWGLLAAGFPWALHFSSSFTAAYFIRNIPDLIATHNVSVDRVFDCSPPLRLKRTLLLRSLLRFSFQPLYFLSSLAVPLEEFFHDVVGVIKVVSVFFFRFFCVGRL
jgi:hypothetical protein